MECMNDATLHFCRLPSRPGPLLPAGAGSRTNQSCSHRKRPAAGLTAKRHCMAVAMAPSAQLPGAWGDWVDGSLRKLQHESLLRMLRPVHPSLDPMQVEVDPDLLDAWVENRRADVAEDGKVSQQAAAAGRPLQQRPLCSLRLFSTNDYLGLSCHLKVRRAAADAALAHGNGPRSSALVGGYTVQHAALEEDLARLKGKEAALLFPTGFAANVAVVAALAGALGPHLFSDALNHASIIDGARTAQRAGACLHVFRHRDMGHLEELLAVAPPGARLLVVTDSLFSMDGTWADLRGLAALRAKHGFLLVIDEAHASLVTGSRGGGWAEECGLVSQVDVVVGTLSKSFGAQGGFVACSRAVRALLLNMGRPYVYSTALPAPVVAAAHAALHVSQEEAWRREHLQALWRLLGARLGVAAQSPIVPLVVGDSAAAVTAAAQLLREGFYVPAIRPPTVPPGSARLRISLSAAHTTEDVEALVAALGRCGLPLRPPPRALHADHTARLHEAVTVDSAAASGERAPAAAAGSAADPRARL